jgi:hypothetical protein
MTSPIKVRLQEISVIDGYFETSLTNQEYTTMIP